MNALFLALTLIAPPGEYDSLVVMHADIERIKAIPDLPNDLEKMDKGSAPQAGPVENKERVLVFLTRRNLKYCSSAGCFYTNPKACEALATDLASLPKIEPKNGVRWSVGASPDSHFEVVYVEDEPELAKKYRVTDLQCPVSVKLSEGKEAARLSGGTAAALSKWYSDCLKTMKQFKSSGNSSSFYIPEPSTIWTHPSNAKDHVLRDHHYVGPHPDSNRGLEQLHSALHEHLITREGKPTGEHARRDASGTRRLQWWLF